MVSILQLAEAGKLGLDDKIEQYLGKLPPPKNQATIHHLLLHTAGLVPKGHHLEYTSKTGFLESVKNAPPESIPGAKYRYTNAGYILLAAIIEEVSLMTYEDYLTKKIFEPLKLEYTSFGIKDPKVNIAQGYSGKTINTLKLHKNTSISLGRPGDLAA